MTNPTRAGLPLHFRVRFFAAPPPHLCAAPGCSVELSRSRAFCLPRQVMLPRDRRNALKAAPHGTPAYRAALVAAVAWLRDGEGEKEGAA